MPRLMAAMTDKELKQRLKQVASVGKAQTFSVGGVPGLSVRWRSPTNIQWVLRIQSGRKNALLSIGSLNPAEPKLKEARQRAAAILQNGGQIPKEDSSIDTSRKRKGATVAGLWPQWIEAQRARSRWKGEDEYRHATQRGEKYVFPQIGDKAVREVTAQDLGSVCLYAASLAGKATVEKVLQCLRLFFRWCSSEGYVDQAKRLPTDKDLIREYLPVMRGAKAMHFAMCPVATLPDFVAELVSPRRFCNPGAMALLFAILTNSRLANICSTHNNPGNYAVWRDFDLGAEVWTIPAQKMKVPGNGDHVVPLSKASMRILKRLEALGLRSEGAVFKGVYGSALSDGVFRKIISTINDERLKHGLRPFVDAESGKPITEHGTARATFKTWAVDTGQDREIVEKALHHAPDGKLGRAYDRSQAIERRRELAERWADYCLSKCPADWYEIKSA